MKIIFLDHFGVICLADKHGKTKKKSDLPDVKEIRKLGQIDNFDKQAIEVLNSVIIETGAEIVVSSDWKHFLTLKLMGKFYLSQGIIKPPIDFTPNLNFESNIFKHRSDEIKLWLQNNTNVTHWIAIDDIYMGDYLSNFVWVSQTDNGVLQEGIKEKVLEFLK